VVEKSRDSGPRRSNWGKPAWRQPTSPDPDYVPWPVRRNKPKPGRTFSKEAGNNILWQHNQKQSAALTSPGYLVPFITVTALFFIFGFITNLNMAPGAPPAVDLRSVPCVGDAGGIGILSAYFVCSAPTSKLIEAIGYKRTMVVSLFIQVAGACCSCPRPRLVAFPLFLTGDFCCGSRRYGIADIGEPICFDSRTGG
jgi:hypothetical protein